MTTGLMIAGGGALLIGDVSSYDAAQGAIKLQQSQDRLQAKQQEVAFSQKTLDNIDTTQKLLGQQMVSAGAQGESLASPSLKAISLDSFDKGQREQRNLQTQEKVVEASYQAKKEALSQQKSALPWQMLGKVASQGMQLGAES